MTATRFLQLFPDQRSVRVNGAPEAMRAEFEPIWRPSRLSEQPTFGPSQSPRDPDNISPQALQDRQFAEGFAAGQADALGEAELKIARALEDCEGQLQRAREAWVAMEADRMAALIEKRTTEAIAAVRTSIAKILEASVMSALERHAMQEVAAKVAQLTSRAAQVSVTVCGREDLANAIACELARRNIEAIVEPTSSPEVSVRFGDAEVETRVNAVAADLLIGAP